MNTISKAGFGLMKFVVAVLSYCDTYREVKPKQDRIEFLKNDLEEKTNILESLKLEIDSLEEKLSLLNLKYENSLRMRQKYSEDLAISEARLNIADRLVVDLVSEKLRWLDELKRLGSEKETTIGTCKSFESLIVVINRNLHFQVCCLLRSWHTWERFLGTIEKL